MIVTPRDAATVVLMRDRRPGGGDPEVLLVRRHKRANFAAGAYVFPGGVLEEEDCSPLARRLSPRLAPEKAQASMAGREPPEKALGLLVAAIRETFEEVGVLLARTAGGERWNGEGQRAKLSAVRAKMNQGALGFLDWINEQDLRLATEELVFFAHWITPKDRPKRFDTRFFLIEVPPGLEVHTDELEVFEHVWLSPKDGNEAEESERLKLMTPTLKNLELLASFATTAEAVTTLRNREVPTILPKIFFTPEGERSVLHPGDAGYDDL